MNIDEARAKLTEREQPVYDDWKYSTFEVEVCRIYVDDDQYIVPAFIGKMVKNILDDSSKNSEMVHLGDLSVRAYMIKRLYFTKDRFVELSDWGKRMLLEKEPELFGDWEKTFSPQLQKRLQSIREKNNNKIVPVPKIVELNFE